MKYHSKYLSLLEQNITVKYLSLLE